MATATKAVEAADVVEDAKELVEDTAEFVEVTASWISQSPKTVGMIALGAGIAIGSVATYLVARKKLAARYQALAEADIQSVKEHYSAIHKTEDSLQELASKYTDEERAAVDQIIAQEGYTSYNEVKTVIEAPETPVAGANVVVEQSKVVTEVVESNIFESDNPDTYFNFDEELKRREEKPDQPFVITQEEFNESEADYDQAELTYYDGDDVLADSKDAPCEVDQIMGYENLLRFGHGSGDPNVVYIRNSKLELDFEVTHSDGKFAKEVLGFDDELQHSHSRRPRRFRDSDE